MKDEAETWTISQLAEELGITPSKIRYYERRKLITPRRSKGQQRIFLKSDRGRLKLILRGTRFGLGLDEIAEILGLGDDQPSELEQLRMALTHVNRIKKEIDERKKELAAFSRDVDTVRARMNARKNELGDTNEDE